MKIKKFYLSALLTATSGLAIGQSFFVPTTYRGAFAPAPETPWTNQWTNWDPQNTNYGSPTVTVSTNITNNTTWTSNNVYLLQGQIFVKNGATLTIEPGTIILGDKNSSGAGLFVTQGSKLNANGTAAQPIVFTSNQPAGQRSVGDWGGIVLMGRASNNNSGGIANIEGFAASADTQYGGGVTPDDNDNSGVLKYVRIEFGGYVYQPNKEINGLTMGAVGRGTTIDNVQVSFANDDAFEWFGGTVNCRHLVSYRNLDDDFDTDNGYNGKVQFGLVVRDPDLADNPSVSTSEGFESDNDPSGTAATPQTSAIFSNITLVGPLRGNTSNVVATGFRRSARIRRNSALKIYNSVFTDFLRGVHIDGAACEGNATNNVIKFRNNLIAGFQTGKATEVNTGSSFNAKTWFGTNQNDSLVSSAGIFTNPYDYIYADYRPAVSSPLLTNYAFDDASIDPYVIKAPVVANNSISYCIGETANALTASTTNSDLTLKWYAIQTGGSVLSNLIPSTSVAGTYNYYVAQAAADGTEGPRTLVTVIVNASPTAPVISANGSTSLCTGSTVDLTSNQTTDIEWSTNETTSTITVGTSGTYSVEYTDGNGCKSTSNEITVNVSNAPLPTIQASGSLNICQGSEVTLTSSTADTYLWSNGATTQSIDVTTAGTYYVTTTNVDACDGVGQSSNMVVTVTALPVASGSIIMNNFTVNFTNTSTGATSISWDFGDGTSSTSQNPTHIYTDNNDYTAYLIAYNNGCSDTTEFELTTLNVQEVEINNAAKVLLYPNPISNIGTLAVEINESTELNINIIDYKGSIVNSIENNLIDAGQKNYSINVNDFENGIYYVVIRTNNSNQIIKMNVIK